MRQTFNYGSNILNNLYVVESPLQALCALEVSLGKKNERNSIIIRLSEVNCSQNNKQLLNIIDLGNWEEKIIFRPDEYNNKILNNVSKTSKLSKIRRKFNSKIESLYIGEFRYSFMHMVRCAVDAPNVYLLDDGAATVNVIKNFILNKEYSPNINEFYPSNPFKKALYIPLYRKYLNKNILDKQLKVLTAFAKDDPIHNIEQLTFENIINSKDSNKSIDKSTVYFYGSKYSEANIISCENEIAFLKAINHFYLKKNKKVIYFAHRDESKDKLSIISQEFNFDVKQTNDIAEVYLLNSNVLPGEIAGAYTSTLNNIRAIFPSLSVTSFRLPKDIINPEFQNNIENVYQFYKTLGLNIMNLEIL